MELGDRSNSSPPLWRVVRLLPAGLRLSVFTAFVLIGYWRDLWEVLNLALTSDVVQYILAVPPIFLFLLYRKRRVFCLPYRGSLREEAVGLSLCLSALMIYVYGSFTFYPLQLHLLSLPIFVTGAFLLLYGFEVLRALAFPVFILTFLNPIPMMFQALWEGRLTLLTAHAVYLVLSFFGIPIDLSTDGGITLTTLTVSGEEASFLIGLPCSGIYSLLGFIFFAAIFAYLAHGSWLRKALFTASGLLLVYSLNIFRVSLMVAMGHFSGYSTALNFFHLFGGSAILFIGILSLLFMGEKLLKISILRDPKGDSQCPSCKKYGDICLDCGRIIKLPNLNIRWKRLATVLVLLLITSQLINQASAINSIAIQNEENAFNFNPSTGEVQDIFSSLEGWSVKFAGRDTVGEERLNLIGVARYILFYNDVPEYLAIFEISDLQSKLHTWRGCLHYQSVEIEIKKVSYTTIHESDKAIVTAENYIANIPSHNQTIYLLSWFDVLPFKANGKIEAWDVKLTLYKYVPGLYDLNSEEVEIVASEATSLAQDLEQHWSQFKSPPTTLVMDLYHNRETVAIVIAAALILSITFSAIRSYREKTQTSSKLKELSENDRLLLNYFKDSQRRPLSLLSIIDAYERKTGTELTPETLRRKIEQFKEERLLEEGLTIKKGQLFITWKAQAI